MSIRNVICFANVILQIEQLLPDSGLTIRYRLSMITPFASSEGPIGVREMQFPPAITYRLELAAAIVAVKHLVR